MGARPALTDDELLDTGDTILVADATLVDARSLRQPGNVAPLLVGIDLDQAALREHRDELRHLGVGGAWAGAIRAG